MTTVQENQSPQWKKLVPVTTGCKPTPQRLPWEWTPGIHRQEPVLWHVLNTLEYFSWGGDCRCYRYAPELMIPRASNLLSSKSARGFSLLVTAGDNLLMVLQATMCPPTTVMPPSSPPRSKSNRCTHDTKSWNIPMTLNNPYPTAFPYGNGMVQHFYQQQESSTTKTVHKVINKGLKTYV